MKEIIEGLENQEQTTTPPTTRSGQAEVKKEAGKILEKTLDKLVDKVVSSRAGAGAGTGDSNNAMSNMVGEVISYCVMGLMSMLVSCLEVYFFPRQIKWIRKKINKLRQTDNNRQGASPDNPPPTPSLIDL